MMFCGCPARTARAFLRKQTMFIPIHDANTLKHINRPYVNYAIIATNIIIWLIFVSPAIVDPETAKRAAISFGFIPSVVNQISQLPAEFIIIPEKFTYISYAFLHADFMHLAGNMLFIWVFGDNIEDAMGHLRYIVFYLLCAAGAAFFHGLVAQNSNSPLAILGTQWNKRSRIILKM